MSRARAPGKVVLSGAYAVLEGAPALVAAVDRFVEADAERAASRVTAEVEAAIASGALARACWFDASALRADGGARKLGLGSSAAILVATMAAVDGVPGGDAARADLLRCARRAHRAAQGGGSGVDVAASVLGGVLRCRIAGDDLDASPHALPGVRVLVLSSATEASTPDLIRRLARFADEDPAAHRALMDRAGEGARDAVNASRAAALVSALTVQRDALAELGRRAGAPIVTDDVARLAQAAAARGAFAGPAGAGGGDVAILVVPEDAPIADLLAAAEAVGLTPLDLQVGARGVHEVDR